MHRIIFALFLFLSTSLIWAQDDPIPKPISLGDSLSTIDETQFKEVSFDSLPKKSKFLGEKVDNELKDSATIGMYKIFQYGKKIATIDTSLTVLKEYKNNYLRKDYFELLPFVNMGHAFNRLGYDFTQNPLLSQLGARSKHYAFFEIEDVKYYEVPTPFTELFFRTTMEQGQLSDATISVNTSPQFNFAFSYRGMRSMGKYVNQRAANEAVRLAFTFKSKNDRYNARAHYVSQTIDNEENGGITEASIELFNSGDENFKERSVLDVRLRGAQSILKGKRSFLDHNFALFKGEKNPKSPKWSIGHKIYNESKYYTYSDTQNSNYFGALLPETELNDRVNWAIVNNRFQTQFQQQQFGKLTAAIEFSKIDYFFPSEEIPITEGEQVTTTIENTQEEGLPESLQATQTFFNANYEFKWRGFDLTADFNKTLFGSQLSDEISLKSKIELKNKFFFEAKALFRNRTPNFNFVRYKSAYEHYNWYNTDLNNEKLTSIAAALSHPLFGQFSGSVQRLESYTFFKQRFANINEQTGEVPDQLLVEVAQSSSPTTYFKLRYESQYTWRKWQLNSTAQYQKVTSSNSSPTTDLHLPEWNIRSTVSFSSDLFQKALFVQAGITGHYFSSYYADLYNPLLGDFIWQDQKKIGNFPRMDVFINARVQRTRIYFKYEHFNANFTGYDYYSAPSYPYRDSILRFGIVWNFFE